jgi:hypothetical protein
MAQPKKTTDYTEIELKAIKCDHYELIQSLQNEIAAINNELGHRANLRTPVIPPVIPPPSTSSTNTKP